MQTIAAEGLPAIARRLGLLLAGGRAGSSGRRDGRLAPAVD